MTKTVNVLDLKPITTQVIPVRLTKTEVEQLDTIADTGIYESRSGAIRAGLGLLYEKHKIDYNTERKIEAERKDHKPRRAPAKVPGPAVEPPPVARPTPINGNTTKVGRAAKKGKAVSTSTRPKAV